jgi:hypothetical protein
MYEQLGKYLTVYLISMFKFIGGPAMGAAYGMTFIEKSLISVLGMMTSVIIISFFGVRLRKWIQKKYNFKRKRFTKRNRRIVHIWRNYGVLGVSFFTPVLFSPVIGTLLVTTLGGKRRKVIGYMLVSAVFWALTISSLSELILDIFLNP